MLNDIKHSKNLWMILKTPTKDAEGNPTYLVCAGERIGKPSSSTLLPDTKVIKGYQEEGNIWKYSSLKVLHIYMRKGLPQPLKTSKTVGTMIQQ